MAEQQKLLMVRDVASYFQVTEETIRDWIRDDKLKAVKINGYFRITIAEIERFSGVRYG